MEFAQKVKDLALRSRHASEHALTEEATKTAVLMPFIQALGFDVFNLNEVVPEFIVDVGTKKGEKVDFLLKIDGKPTILIEAKPISASLGNTQHSQLFRYFTVTEARLAILSNGREIWFFSDTDERNKMDKKPFFVFDLQSFDESKVKDLALFHKSVFNIDTILETASNLKFVKAAAEFLKAQISNPSDDLVRIVARQIFDGTITKSVIEQMRPMIPRALDEIIRDRIQDKLNIAFKPEPKPGDQAPTLNTAGAEKSGVVTTGDEIQAFYIVRAIAARLLPVERVTMRDAKSYCSILIDDNNRKPLCRLYFNAKSSRLIGLFDAEKNETKHPLADLNAIFNFAAEIDRIASTYVE